MRTDCGANTNRDPRSEISYELEELVLSKDREALASLKKTA